MSILDYLFARQKSTASVARERLQIIMSHERGTSRGGSDYLPLLKQDLLQVVAKYVDIDSDQVKVELERFGNGSILELNITLPSQDKQEKCTLD